MAACPVYGFVVAIEVRGDVDDAAKAALWTSFIREAIEARGLTCAGGNNRAIWSPVVSSEAGQATDADRQAVLAWTRARPEVVSVTVGPLIDLESIA
jgi:uncharacterized protein YggL (DUF469 family)